MNKITEFSERLSQILDYFEINENLFGKKLNYERSQTIYDIVNSKNKPSFKFIEKFVLSEYSEIIDLKWLITGDGNMLKSENKQPIKPFDGNKIESKVMELLEENRDLHKENKILLTKNNNLEKRIIEMERDLHNQKNDAASNLLARTA